MFNWEIYRHGDHSINFYSAYIGCFGESPSIKAANYASHIQSLRPICSRQAAAIIIANMREMRDA